MKELFLNDGWLLHEAPLSWNIGDAGRVMSLKSGWLSCSLPCDVRVPLIQNGIIKDPVLRDYCFSSEWTADRSWWFVRKFDASELNVSEGPVELCLESLDAWAEIFLNGDHIGTHKSVHYPFCCDLKSRLRGGENVLCVRMTAGMEKVTEEQLGELDWCVCHEKSNGCPERGDLRRTSIRRPQYNSGWDWSPKAVSCGMMGNASIRCFGGTAVRSVNAVTAEASANAVVRFTAEIENFDDIRTAEGCLTITISRKGKVCARRTQDDLFLTSGLNYAEMDLTVPAAELWWPAGCGDQPLYEADVLLESSGEEFRYPTFHFGIRTVRLDQTRGADGQRCFRFFVNNTAVFCKGANWVPGDVIYSRVTEEKYRTLIREARTANFNMLRVWGGGCYETDAFYDSCDRCGILLWHDFMFACGAYPDHEEWFRLEVEREADYQTKRLRTHPCLCLWCGNNELHRYLNSLPVLKEHPEKHYGLFLANSLEKEVEHRNSPQIPYWNSSPYGGSYPDSDAAGDTHYWGQCTMNSDVQKRIEPLEYDKVKAAFVSEYGYIGPCSGKTMEEYFDGLPVRRGGDIWKLHTNTFEKDTISAGIEKHYPVTAKDLGTDDYLLYAGMVQSTMLNYSLEAMRAKERCGGSLFWMFNDTWGETGWSVVDYGLRRKPAFYGVMRAFAPRKLILRREDGMLCVTGCNDTEQELETDAEVGYCSLDGSCRKLETVRLCLPARSRGPVLRIPMPQGNLRTGLIAVFPKETSLAPERLYTGEIRQFSLPEACPKLLKAECRGGRLTVTVGSDSFLHGLFFEGAEKCSDNYFELLPGQGKTVSFDAARVTMRAVGSPLSQTIAAPESGCPEEDA